MATHLFSHQPYQSHQHRRPATPMITNDDPGATGREDHGSSSVGMSTTRARSHSPRLLACGSSRALAATPSPSRPAITKFSARTFGSSYLSTGSGAVSGSSSLSLATVRNPASHA